MYLERNHYCCMCSTYLGPDDGDGICAGCDEMEAEAEEYYRQQDEELQRQHTEHNALDKCSECGGETYQDELDDYLGMCSGCAWAFAWSNA